MSDTAGKALRFAARRDARGLATGDHVPASESEFPDDDWTIDDDDDDDDGGYTRADVANPDTFAMTMRRALTRIFIDLPAARRDR